jgi:hypothetical protein
MDYGGMFLVRMSREMRAHFASSLRFACVLRFDYFECDDVPFASELQ